MATDKAKERFNQEVAVLKRRIQELEKAEAERQRIEETLRQSQERYRNLFELSPIGIAVVDWKGIITDCNSATLKIGGYSREEIVGKHFTKLSAVRIRDIPKYLAVFSSMMRGKIPKPFEVTYQRKDRTLGWTEIHVALLKAGDKKQGLQVIQRDVTEQRQMGEALRESEEKYRTIFESTGTMMVIIEEDTTISLVNEEFEKVSGYTKEEVEGKKSWAEFVAEEDLARLAEYHRLRRIDPQTVPRNYEARFIDRQGSVKDCLVTVALIPGSTKSLVSLLDITEGKRLEEERQKLEAQLIQAQKMEAIGRLAGGVAHDFNNLLTVIIGYSDLVLGQLGEHDKLGADIKEIKRAGERAATLTRQLLAFSRRQIIQPEVLNFNDMVTNMEKMLRRLIGEDITLNTILEPHLERIKADLGQVEQVIMNLVVNARDAMPEGGKLTITVENTTLDDKFCKSVSEARPGRFVCLSVEDTGIGMDKEILGHIFEPFFSTKKTGTGLGLSVVYGIVKQHEGWINVSSEPGKGSVFKVYLPAITAAQVSDSKETASLAGSGGSGERILLVEDEDGIRAFASRVLRGNGYAVFEAASAEEALAIFKKERGEFHLIYCDVVLPDVTGLQLVDQFLSLKPGLPVLMSSGYSEEKALVSVIKEREFSFLQKPYTLTELLKAVKESMGQAAKGK